MQTTMSDRESLLQEIIAQKTYEYAQKHSMLFEYVDLKFQQLSTQVDVDMSAKSDFDKIVARLTSFESKFAKGIAELNARL